MMLSKLLSIASFVTFSIAANSSSYATFVYNSTYGGSLIWSITAEESSGDVFFHMESRFAASWTAIGFGSQMDGALMVVAYTSANGTGVTVAPRLANGHVQPLFYNDRKVERIYDEGLRTPNQVTDAAVTYVDGVCRNCTTWNGGSLDLKNPAAPFIFAVGPSKLLHDDSPTAWLNQHTFHGSFIMNMPPATTPSNGSVPKPINNAYTAIHSSLISGFDSDQSSYRSTAHAGLMLISWIVLFPIGSLVLRLLNKVKLHAIVQCIGLVLILVAFGLGIYISQLSERSRSFNTPHQIIGIILTIGLLAQLGLGIVGHRIFKRTNQPTKLGKIHMFLGSILISGAIVNGGLGFSLAQRGAFWFRYFLLILIVFVLYTVIRIAVPRCMARRKNAQHPGAAMPMPGSNYHGAVNGNQPYHGAGNHGVGPDGYQYQQSHAPGPKEPHVQSVPLTTYHHSNESEAHLAGPAQQPRPMV